MSVAPSWRDLPPGRIPKRLKHLIQEATGSNQYYCWYFGEGPFGDGLIQEKLTLRQDKPQHGMVEPAEAMAFDAYQSFLAGTRNEWRVIAEDT
jgi:hypothetical protein